MMNPGLTLKCLAVRLSVFFTLTALPFTTADAVQSINAQTFNPSVSDHFVLLEDGFNTDWPKTAKYYFGANWNYADAPLILMDANGSTKIADIISSQQTFDLMFGFKATKKFGLFIGLPIHFNTFPNNTSITQLSSFPVGTTSGIGDLKLMAKIRLTDDDSNTSLALIPEFHLPTGATANFMSDASTYVGARLALERQFETWSLGANIGFGLASNAFYQLDTTTAIDMRKRFNIGAGGYIPFSEEWGGSVEFNTNLPIPFNTQLNPNELYAGLRYKSSENLVFTGGASVGKIGGPTGLAYRMIAGIRYTIYEDAQPTPAPPRVVYTPSPTPMPVMTPAPAVKQLVVMHSTHVEVLKEVSFEHASANLNAQGKMVLDQVAKALQENKKYFTKIMVDGHTNRLGSDAYNMKLSLARAKSVKGYLVSRGVPADALEARGYGYRKPMLPYSDKRAMEVNRRVEFLIVK